MGDGEECFLYFKASGSVFKTLQSRFLAEDMWLYFASVCLIHSADSYLQQQTVGDPRPGTF